MIEVWVAALDELSPERIAQLWSALSPEESARAARLVRDEDAQRFAATRGLLRELLGQALDAPPADVAIRAGESGKPRLDTDRPHFNVSHSHDRAVIALAVDHEIGVDVERVRPDRDVDALAPEVLSPAELTTWRALEPDRRVDAFHAAWARREAYVKGRAEGLGIDLRRLTEITRGERWAITDPDLPGEPWTVAAVDAGPDYAGAVAAPGEGWELTVRPLA